jgi:activator of HSP90 ATPase
MGEIDVWIMHKRKVVQVTDFPGVPVEVTGYVSEEAKQAAESRGFPTVSEIGFNRDDWKSFDEYSEAESWAQAKAKELGYTVEHSYRDWDADDYDDFDDDDDY